VFDACNFAAEEHHRIVHFVSMTESINATNNKRMVSSWIF
jgi:hypothetical protein